MLVAFLTSSLAGSLAACLCFHRPTDTRVSKSSHSGLLPASSQRQDGARHTAGGSVNSAMFGSTLVGHSYCSNLA